MRLSVVLLIVSLAGILGGAALIGPVALGAAIMGDSLAVGAWALLREAESRPQPSLHSVPTLHDVLEKARHAP